MYRWAYDYSVPGAAEDFIPQNQPPARDEPLRELVHERHPAVPGCACGDRRMVAVAAAADGQAMAGARRDRGFPRRRRMPLPAAKVGLGVFLAVVGSLFVLFISAYSMRMSVVGLAAAAGARGCCGSTRACWS